MHIVRDNLTDLTPAEREKIEVEILERLDKAHLAIIACLRTAAEQGDSEFRKSAVRHLRGVSEEICCALDCLDYHRRAYIVKEINKGK